MSTNFYLADPRIMSQEEIELARGFDKSALLCNRSSRNKGIFYSLNVDLTSLLSLPQDMELVKVNNFLGIETVGDLITSLKNKDSIVQISSEGAAESYQALYMLRKKRQHVPGWEDVAPELTKDSLEKLSVKLSNAMDLIRRYHNIEDTSDFCPN